MAESTLSLNIDNLRKAIARYLGYGQNPVHASLSADAQADIDAIMASGLRQFYFPATLGERYAHKWSFLMPTTTLTTSAPYETGTVTIVAGVATLASGTFPSWAADGEMIIDGLTYTVASRDGNTQVTLDDTSVTASAGTTYSLVRPIITLPDDFGGLLSPLVYQPGQAQYGRPLVQMDADGILAKRQYSDVLAPPSIFALRPKTFTAATGQRYELMFWPVPDAAYILTYRYRVRPNALGSSEYPYGGVEHSETVLASCLSKAEERRLDSPGPLHAKFLEHLAASISFDREVGAPRTLGIDRDTGDVECWPCDALRSNAGYLIPDGYTLG